MKGKDKQYQTLSPKLGENAKIEYMLQLSLGTSTAIVTKVRHIATPQVTQPFERAVNQKKMQVVYSFVDAADLDLAKNDKDNIATDGFPIGPEGRIFSTGLLKLEKSGASTYTVLLCKIAVGRSLCYPVKNERDKHHKINRGNYDSVYLKNEEYGESTAYKFEYKIYDKTHVLPEYLVDFKFDESMESNLRVVLSNSRSQCATI